MLGLVVWGRGHGVDWDDEVSRLGVALIVSFAIEVTAGFGIAWLVTQSQIAGIGFWASLPGTALVILLAVRVTAVLTGEPSSSKRSERASAAQPSRSIATEE